MLLLVPLFVLLLAAPVSAGERRMAQKVRQQALREQRQVSLAHKIKGLNAPMVAGVRVAPASERPDMASYAGADPASGVIYADGPLDNYTMAHEMAHLLEAKMTDADRRRFARAMGRPNAPWDVGRSPASGDSAGTQGYRRSLSERFADLAAMVALDRVPGEGVVDAMYLDKQPTRRRLLRFGRELERFGKRNGLAPYSRPSAP